MTILGYAITEDLQNTHKDISHAPLTPKGRTACFSTSLLQPQHLNAIILPPLFSHKIPDKNIPISVRPQSEVVRKFPMAATPVTRKNSDAI